MIQAQPIRRSLPGAAEERGCKEAGSLETLPCAGGRIQRPGRRRGCRRSGGESSGSRRQGLTPPLRRTCFCIIHHVAHSPSVSSGESPRPPSGSIVHQRDSKNPAKLSYPQLLFIKQKRPTDYNQQQEEGRGKVQERPTCKRPVFLSQGSHGQHLLSCSSDIGCCELYFPNDSAEAQRDLGTSPKSHRLS